MENCRALLGAAGLKLGTLVIAAATALALGGPALAQDTACPDPGTGWTVSNPSADDRQGIMDALAGYAWALDERDAAAFADLFVEDHSYEVCTGGNMRIYKTTKKEELQVRIQQQFDEIEDIFRTRHIISNVLLSQKNSKVDFKATMLTLVQRIAGDRVQPEPDYTADLRGTLVKDDVWKFESLTVRADTPTFVPMGR